MKKIVSFILTIAMMAANVVNTVFADDGIKVMLDGKEIVFDVSPQIINDRTMVPVRAIFEALGATVEWNSETQTVTSVKDDITVNLKVNDNTMCVNESVITIDSPAIIIDGRTLVPLRAISEAYAADVIWDENTRTVSILLNSESDDSPGYDDISANVAQITDFINQGLYLEAIQECENAKAWHQLSPADIDIINGLKNEAQIKYDEYVNSERNKMIDIYACELLIHYKSMMKDPSSFKLNSIYAGYNSSILQGYDFVAVVDVSGKNSYGAMTRNVYTMLMQSDTGKYIIDLEGYADDMIDYNTGMYQIEWMDVLSRALDIQLKASQQLNQLDAYVLEQAVLAY